ncbi:ABC transporter permease, partial [Bacteroides fragilis]
MRQLYYTFRTLLRGRGVNLTKIVSLTLGLLVGILLFARVAFELNYDSYYQEPENLFLTLRTVVSQGEKKEPVCNNYGKLPAAIRENFPDEVEDATLIDLFSRSSLYHEGQEKKDVILATSRSHIFSTLGVKVLSGNVSELDNMDALFISRSLAQSLFADADPIGKTVMINIDYPLTVRGVFEDIPENAEFRFDGVYSFVTRANRFRDERGGWRGDISYTCMVRFRHPEDVEKVTARMPDMMKKYIQYNKDWFEEFSFITPSQFHLQKKESRKIISILSILGFAILLIAGMNNVLISISSLPQRAKSVGVHKCSGASTGHIYRMFLWESALLILVSLLGVIVLLLYFKPEIEDLSGASLATLFTWRTLWVPALVTIFLFLLIGLLPGKLFSSIPVTQVFHRFTGYRASWKYPLLFVQFTGVAFILGLLMIILLQYNQVMNRSMGYKIDNLVIGWGPFDSMDKIDGILRGLPFIEASCNSASFIYNGHTRQSFTDINGKRFMGCIDFIDEHYVPILGLQILQGRNVHQDGEVLVNEELLRQVGWTDSPIGRKLMEDNYEWGTVVGVVKDYVAQSAYQPQASV